MPSIVGKRRGKQTYYYLVESARVEGKSRIVSQQYLGSAEEVMAKLAGSGSGEPVRSQHKRFGDLAVVWSMLSRLDMAGVVDAVVPRRSDAGASVGTYIALAGREPDRGRRCVEGSSSAFDRRRVWGQTACASSVNAAATRNLSRFFGH